MSRLQGVDADYDAAEAAVEAKEGDLNDHLKEVRRAIGGGREVCYVSVNKDSHLIEVPQQSPPLPSIHPQEPSQFSSSMLCCSGG